MGPYELLQRVGKVAYELKLPIVLAPVHTEFYVSMLKKCIGDPMFILPLEGLEVNAILSYKKIPTEMLEQQVKWLRNKQVASVKVFCKN